MSLLPESFSDTSFDAVSVNRFLCRAPGDRDPETGVTELVAVAAQDKQRRTDRGVRLVRENGFKLGGTVQTVFPSKEGIEIM